MTARRRLTRLLLGALTISILTVGPAPADTYVAGTTFVARGADITVADFGVVECNAMPAPSTGGACIPWSGGGGGVRVVDAVNGTNVAFQACVDNDGNSLCGGVPTVAGCDDDIVFSHHDNGTFSNPLAAPTSFRAGCPGGFRGWVVFLCQGTHATTAPHTHEVTTGTVTAAGSGGPSGEFCGGVPLGKPYIRTTVSNGCLVQGTMQTGSGLGLTPTATTSFAMSFSIGTCLAGGVTASGVVTGSCFAATGSGQFSSGHKFTLTWAGTSMVFTPVGTSGAAGSAVVVEDPLDTGSCSSFTANRFAVFGSFVLP